MLSKFRHPDLGLLLIRLGLAYEFITHAWQKLSHSQMTIRFFGHLGLPFPHFTMYLVCGVELLGGTAMLIGFWTEILGLLLAADMLGVILTVRVGPMAHTLLAGHDFEFMLLLMSVGIALIGSGRYAVDRPKRQQILV